MLVACRFLLAILLVATAAAAQDPAGEWTGEIGVPGAPLRIEVVLFQDDGDWAGTIAIPVQNLRDFDLSGVAVDGRSVAFRMEGIPGTPEFDGQLNEAGDRIEGAFLQGGATLEFFLERADAAAAASAEADREALEGFVDQIRAAMDSLSVPGMGLAIIRGQEVILAEGLGLRDVERELPVTPQTSFPIGSSTKAFTAALIGALVDDGLLEWEDPVIDYLPSFRLADPVATQGMTALDLLIHRSGLPRHDVMWYAAPDVRGDIFSKLRHLEPNVSFRSRWQYQNLMYLAAGVLAEHLAGSSWEDQTRDRILRPLGMDSATLTIDDLTAQADFARGFGGGRNAVEPMDYYQFTSIGPAGSINASTLDMARWIKFQFGDGSVNNTQVLSAATLRYLHTPQIVVTEQPGLTEAPYLLYSPGWFVEPYRGHRMIQHGGNIDGFSALVGFMPDEEIGVVVLTNKNASPLPRAVMLSAFDRLLGVEPRDWLAEVSAAPPTQDEEDADEADRIADTTPSRPLGDFAGTYRHPGYGDVTITASDNGLHVSYYRFDGPLEHVHYDTFAFTLQQVGGLVLRLTFFTNAHGEVDRLSFPLELMSAPIEFERRPDEQLAAPDYLAAFVGSYRGSGLTFTVEMQGNERLLLTVAGQGTWRLDPTRPDAFDVDGLPGFSVRFEREDDQVVRLIGVQPNAVVRADRVP